MTPPTDPAGGVTVRQHDEAAHAERVIAALGKRPDGEALMHAATGVEGVHLVGGAVRDILLRRHPRELDVVVEGDASAFARLLGRVGGEVTSHDRFGTATVQLGDHRVDVARSRSETYPAPGALPEVQPAPLAADLLRRDFTVNAIAVSLSSPRGTLHAAPFALDDLHSERLRVLHDRSFIDDPTRLLRLGRYAARLGFKVERHTGRLAADALTVDALATVSGARVGAELRLALVEPDPLRALATLARLDVLEALQPALTVDTPLARRALELLPADGRADLLTLAACAWGFASPDGLRRWLDELEFTARDRDVVTVAACEAPAIARAIAPQQRPSRLAGHLRSRPLEAVALAGALGPAPGAAARFWLDGLRHVRLEIDGHDLVAAGVPEGPEIGRRLSVALARKLDGELDDGREAELAAALAAEPEMPAQQETEPYRPADQETEPDQAAQQATARERGPRADSIPAPMRSEANALRWSGRRGHYEVYYVSLTDAGSGVGAWIRYTMLAPLEGDATASLWFMAMEPGGALYGLKETYPIQLLEARAQPFELDIDIARLDDGGMRGGFGEVAWDLQWTARLPPYKHVHPLLERAKIAKTVLTLPHPDLEISGTLRFGGRELTLEGARGGQAHLWGSKHAARWAWTHCNDFRTADGELAADTFIDAVSVFVPRFGREVGPSTPVVARLLGQDFIATSPLAVLRAPSEFSLTRWHFVARAGKRRIDVHVDAPRETLVGVTYHDPDGELAYCYNSEIATMRVEISDRAGSAWKLRETLVSDGRAHFEYAQREPVADVELLVK